MLSSIIINWISELAWLLWKMSKYTMLYKYGIFVLYIFGYEMIIAYLALSALLAIYRLVSNARSWNDNF